MIIGSLSVEKLGLDELWYVVSPHNPFKIAGDMAPDELRVKMVKEAIRDYPLLRVCDIEMALPTPSYTIQTLKALKERFPHTVFTMLIGEDNLERLHEWKDIEQLLEMVNVVVYKRKDTVYKPHPLWKDKVNFIDLPLVDISSTYVRNLCSEDKPITFLVHPTTEKIIQKHRLFH